VTNAIGKSSEETKNLFRANLRWVMWGEESRDLRNLMETAEMKWNKLLIKSGIIIIGVWSLFIYGFNKAEGAEYWLFQTTSAGNIYYYDSTSIKLFSNNILWVWVRIIETTGFSKKDLEELKDPEKALEVIKEAQKKSTSEWKQLFEINCSARMVRVLSATLYDMNGIIKEDYEIPSEWAHIAQNSVTNHLTEILCPKRRLN